MIKTQSNQYCVYSYLIQHMPSSIMDIMNTSCCHFVTIVSLLDYKIQKGVFKTV